MKTITKRVGQTVGVACDFTEEFRILGDKAASATVEIVSDDTGSVIAMGSALIVTDVFVLSDGEVRFWLLDGVAGVTYYLRVRVLGTTTAGVAGVYRDTEIVRVVVSAP